MKKTQGRKGCCAWRVNRRYKKRNRGVGYGVRVNLLYDGDAPTMRAERGIEERTSVEGARNRTESERKI